VICFVSHDFGGTIVKDVSTSYLKLCELERSNEHLKTLVVASHLAGPARADIFDMTRVLVSSRTAFVVRSSLTPTDIPRLPSPVHLPPGDGRTSRPVSVLFARESDMGAASDLIDTQHRRGYHRDQCIVYRLQSIATRLRYQCIFCRTLYNCRQYGSGKFWCPVASSLLMSNRNLIR